MMAAHCDYCGNLTEHDEPDVCAWAAEFLSGEDFQDLLRGTLPYSTIPTTRDAAEVVAWFLNHGWRPNGKGA